MKTRLLTSLYLAIALVLAFLSRFLTLYIFDLIIGLIAVVGAVEVARVLERTKKFSTISIVGIYPAILYVLFFIAIYYKLSWHFYLIFILSAYVLLMLISFVSSLIFKKSSLREINKYNLNISLKKHSFNKAINSGFVFIYPTLLFGTLILLNHLAEFKIIQNLISNNANIIATFFLLLAIIITVCCDSLAMFTGMVFKGPKLCPLISPNKTISGAIGGVVGGTLSSLLLFYIFTLFKDFSVTFANIGSIWLVFVIGLIGSVMCQIGDIFASYLKRRARVKDYGTIFPGHGGVMDRFDGLIFTSAFVFLTLIVLVAI